MRGNTYCRAHRDAELGPRGAGAPRGNLNALVHGAYSHPLPSTELDDLARRIVDRPGDLSEHVGLLLCALDDRVRDPLLVLVALRRALPSLIAQVAGHLFRIELRAFLAPLPPEMRASFHALIRSCAPRNPEAGLRFLRRLVRERREQR
jgi:hypothetical protein